MDNDLKLKISASPHVRSSENTSDIMFDVVLALVPATAYGFYLFGWYAALLVFVCIGSCVACEALYQHCMGRKVTVGDFSAVLTGLLLGLNLPPGLPILMAILGSCFAIIVVKQLFGGLGQNFMNPALGARCFLILSFSRYMTNFTYDGVTSATPLALLKNTGEADVWNMFLGNTAGTIGETSAAALLIGAAYLMLRRIISPKIPFCYIGTFALCIVIYAAVKGYDIPVFLGGHICGGGLILGAFFMATDYVTSPITPAGKIVYGVFLGLMTFVLRIFGPSAEGVSYSIIIGNLLVPLIERVTRPKYFGYGADGKSGKAKKDKTEQDAEKSESFKEGAKDAEILKKQKADIPGVLKAITAICLITLIMGAILGTVYNVTKEPIEKAEQIAKEEAYKEVYPYGGKVISPMDYGMPKEQYDKFIESVNKLLAVDGSYGDARIEEINFVLGSESMTSGLLGYILTVKSSKGYGGDIRLIVGIDKSLTVKGISFLELNETAGLGMKADTEQFKEQFKEKRVPAFTYTKTGSSSESEIDAISGATITTTAVTNMVNAAITAAFIVGGGD